MEPMIVGVSPRPAAVGCGGLPVAMCGTLYVAGTVAMIADYRRRFWISLVLTALIWKVQPRAS